MPYSYTIVDIASVEENKNTNGKIPEIARIAPKSFSGDTTKRTARRRKATRFKPTPSYLII